MFTEPFFLISILLFPRTLPFTLPYTITSPAMMSAVNFAVAPTVSFRSSRWTSPLTVRQSKAPRCPRFRLSHAGSTPTAPSRGPVSLPVDASYLCSSWSFPPKTPERALAADSFANFSVPGPQLAVYAISCDSTSDSLGTGAQLTHRLGATMFQVSSLVRDTEKVFDYWDNARVT